MPEANTHISLTRDQCTEASHRAALLRKEYDKLPPDHPEKHTANLTWQISRDYADACWGIFAAATDPGPME